MKNRFITSIALTAILFTGCAKVPQAEIDSANAAVEQAKTAGAEIYVPEKYVALQDSLKGVMATIESRKSGWFKNYATVKEHLDSVIQFAGEVEQQTEARKEELKEEIQNTIGEVKTLLQSDRQLMLEAPNGKEGKSALGAIEDEINAIETLITETDASFEVGEYFATLDKAKVAKEKAVAINTELSGVIAKYKSNIKGKK